MEKKTLNISSEQGNKGRKIRMRTRVE